MKLSEQLYSSDCYQVLHTYWYIYSKCKNQVTVYLISRLSINGQKYMTVFLDLQIFDDFEVKYLPLPKQYDTNSNVPFVHRSLIFKKQLKHLWALPYFRLGCHLKTAPKKWLTLTLSFKQCWQKRPLKKINRHLQARLIRKLHQEGRKG